MLKFEQAKVEEKEALTAEQPKSHEVEWEQLVTLVDTNSGVDRIGECILHGEIQRAEHKRSPKVIKEIAESQQKNTLIPPVALLKVKNYTATAGSTHSAANNGKKLYAVDGVTRLLATQKVLAEGKRGFLQATISKREFDWLIKEDRLEIEELFEFYQLHKRPTMDDYVNARGAATDHPLHKQIQDFTTDLRDYESVKGLGKLHMTMLYRMFIYRENQTDKSGINVQKLMHDTEDLIEKQVGECELEGNATITLYAGAFINAMTDFFYGEGNYEFGDGIFNYFPAKDENGVKRTWSFYEGCWRFMIAYIQDHTADKKRMLDVMGKTPMVNFSKDDQQFKEIKSKIQVRLVAQELERGYNKHLSPERRKYHFTKEEEY